MNKKGNQRYQETKNRIKGALLSLLESGTSQISVRQICERAEIHRTTFYGHYEDLNALFQEMVSELYQTIMDFLLPDRKHFDPDGFEKVFRLAREEKAFFLYYFKRIRPELRTEILVPDLLLENETALEEQMGLKNQEELLYRQSFFSAGTTALLVRWLENGCKESPAELGLLVKHNYMVFFGQRALIR